MSPIMKSRVRSQDWRLLISVFLHREGSPCSAPLHTARFGKCSCLFGGCFLRAFIIVPLYCGFQLFTCKIAAISYRYLHVVQRCSTCWVTLLNMLYNVAQHVCAIKVSRKHTYLFGTKRSETTRKKKKRIRLFPNAQLPECHGSSRCDIERINPMGHRDASYIIGIINDGCSQAIAFSSHDDSQTRLCQ